LKYATLFFISRSNLTKEERYGYLGCLQKRKERKRARDMLADGIRPARSNPEKVREMNNNNNNNKKGT